MNKTTQKVQVTDKNFVKELEMTALSKETAELISKAPVVKVALQERGGNVLPVSNRPLRSFFGELYTGKKDKRKNDCKGLE